MTTAVGSLREFATFSASNALAPVTIPCPAARAALADGGFRSIPTITNVDPPAHTRTRRIAQAAFTPRRVAQMDGVVRGLVRDYLDRHRFAGRSDIVAELTWELPALVLFHILGVPASDITEVKEGAKNRLRFMFGRADDDEQVSIAAWHGPVLALLRGARRRPASPAARRLHVRPRAHP